MIKSIASILIASLLISFSVNAQTANIDKLRKTANESVSKNDRSVEIKLLSGVKKKGKIISVTQDSFSASIEPSAAEEMFQFADVASIKRPGRGWTPGAIIIVAAAATAAAIVIGIYLKICRNELGCGAN